MSILEDIVARNQPLLEERKQLFPPAVIEKMARAASPSIAFAEALRGERVKIIAEIKRASPSRGVIREDFEPAAIARSYRAGGAVAVSVLTEGLHFQGLPGHLMMARAALAGSGCPLLRKDFIWEEYQLIETRAWRADAVLLVAALLPGRRLGELLDFAHGSGLAALVEVHDEAETDAALAAGAGIIGINNRDLRTFRVDLAVTERLRPRIPSGKIVVSESGIRGRADIDRLKALKVDAALIGEALMAAPDPGGALKEFV
jgi:indole-3-glycerol phosphate synthase